MLRKLTFDIINTKKTLRNLSLKPKSNKNMLLKNMFESVYDVCYS